MISPGPCILNGEAFIINIYILHTYQAKTGYDLVKRCEMSGR